MAEAEAAAPVKGGVTPYLMVDGAVKAAELYQKAFGAELVALHPVDDQGRTLHVHLYINGASVMLSDPFPEQGQPKAVPAGYNLMLRVDDIDARFKRAVDAGMEVTMPLGDMFWGDRYAMLKDRFGVRWALSQPLK